MENYFPAPQACRPCWKLVEKFQAMPLQHKR